MDRANYDGAGVCASVLVVIAGQSNALGFTLGGDDLPPHLRKPIARVQIWDPTLRAFAPLRAGVNTKSPNNPGNWGPEGRSVCSEVRKR